MLEQIMKLNEITRAQATIIDELVILLLQHVSTEDEGFGKVLEDIKEITE